MAAARGLLRMDRPLEALAAAETGMSVSWGDNLLRSATTACEALMALGRADDAEALSERVLAEVPELEEAMRVRTPRYRKKLAECSDPKE